MSVLVINSGSSSLKYQLVEVEEGTAMAGGLVERIGEADSGIPDHAAAMSAAIAELGPALAGNGVRAVGHRVVHGGDVFRAPTLIDDTVHSSITGLTHVAPLHNAPALVAIDKARKVLPEHPHVAVFDTAFHATIPPEAATYAIPETWRLYRLVLEELVVPDDENDEEEDT